MIEDDRTYDTALSGISQQGDIVIFAAQDAQHEQNLWIAYRDFSRASQLTHINRRLEQYSSGKTQLIEYLDANGVSLHAALLLPVNHQEGHKYPLIVWVYGGSMLSNYLNRYGSTAVELHNMQLLATRGYAVLLPDTPLKVGTPMADLMTTVLPAIDKVVEMGIADPEKLGVMGASYGGYSTLALIVQTTRFKAAVMENGFGNLFSSYGVMLKSGLPLNVGWAEEGQGRMGGPPWQFRDRYVQNSPVFYLDRVQTPLLIIQGGMDVSDFQSDEIFVGLRRLGKNVTYVRYEQEGHGLRGFVNKIDYWKRVIELFDSHLGKTGPVAPSSR